jgi:translation initiation factor 5A
MVLKLIDATQARVGNTILIDQDACSIKSIETSKTGKHGHAKCRIEAVGIFTGKKKVIAVPGHERFEVPEVKKMKGQILSVSDNSASLMDLESYETIDVPFPEDLKELLAPEKQVEYWDIEGKKSIMRIL